MPGRWCEVLKGQGGGSLFVKTHPKSQQPVGRHAAESGSEAQPVGRGVRHRQPGCRLQGAADRRMGQPGRGPEARRAAGVQRAGDEVWFSVWNGKEAANRRSWSSTTRPATEGRDQGQAPDHADRQVQCDEYRRGHLLSDGSSLSRCGISRFEPRHAKERRTSQTRGHSDAHVPTGPAAAGDRRQLHSMQDRSPTRTRR
jgi:hypothetical protein